MIELFRGYPAYFYFGIFESYFGKEIGAIIVQTIKDDGLIKVVSEKQPAQYSLTPKGVDFAISMINLEHSEKMLKNSKRIKNLTIAIIFLSVLTLASGLAQIFM